MFHILILYIVCYKNMNNKQKAVSFGTKIYKKGKWKTFILQKFSICLNI